MTSLCAIANCKLPNTCPQTQPGHLNPAQALTASAQALTRAWDPQPSIFAPNLPRHRGVLLPPSPSRRRSENTPIADLDPPGWFDFANASFSDSLIFVSSFWAWSCSWLIGKSARHLREKRLMCMLWMVVGNWKSPSMEEFVSVAIVHNQLGPITRLSFLYRFLFWGFVRH